MYSGRLHVLLQGICGGLDLVLKGICTVQWRFVIVFGRNLCGGGLAVVLEGICTDLVVEWKAGCSVGGICAVEDRR